jgi:hypothetical protein
MTFEHKIVVGLDDIKAVTLECCQCHVRLTMSPDEVRFPQRCRHCDAAWLLGDPSRYLSGTSAQLNFVDAIAQIRKQMKEGVAVKILLEFENKEK